MRLDRRQLVQAWGLSLFAAVGAEAAGSETFGKGPQTLRWADAAGLDAALQHKSSVYWTERWDKSRVSNHETAYFKGGTVKHAKGRVEHLETPDKRPR